MKITSHKRKSAREPLNFTIRQIRRETLALILAFAEEGIEKNGTHGDYSGLLELVQEIEAYINSDDEARAKPLKIQG